MDSKSGGPGSYEDWMLGNLQRAFAEVDGRSQAVQNHHKRHYDQKRREADIYEKGQLVLVYRPTRQVGKAEKLLHRWQGPYTVVRRLTPLNYEVQLPVKKKTEVVHVERLKRFVDLAFVADRQEAANLRPEEGGRQIQVQGGEASGNPKSDETETSGPGEAETKQPAGPEGSNNRGEQGNRGPRPGKKKKVKFILPEKEGLEPRVDDRAPEVQLEAEQRPAGERRYPLRIRKERLMLSKAALLVGLLTLATVESMGSNQTATSATWRSIFVVSGVLWWAPIDGAKEIKLSNQGVIFQSVGQRFFSDSEWVIVTDLTFQQPDKILDDLNQWLITKSR